MLRHPRRQARERAPSLARLPAPYTTAPSVLHHLSSIHWTSSLSISPRGEQRKKKSGLAKGAQRGSKTRCPRTVQIDVAVVRLLFGPSLSPLGYGVGSPRSRRLLWLLQTLSWSAQSIFSSFGRMSCCRTYGRVGEFSLLLDRAGETVCHYM